MNMTHEMPQLLKKQRPVPRLLYPSLIVAAVSVTLVSLLGIAGITGRLPSALAYGAAVANGDTTEAAVRLPATPGPCTACGVIESVNAVETRGGGSGVGAVLGGIAGAVIGNSIGGGSGRTALTLLGGGAGAYAGNEIEKNGKRHIVWQTRVRMDDGTLRRIATTSQPEFGVGAKVKVVNGQIVARV